MGELLLLLGNDDPGAELGPGVAQKLAALGITEVSVLRDERTTAIVLEGWAFNIGRSADTVVRLLTTDPSTVQVLRPVIESAVHQ